MELKLAVTAFVPLVGVVRSEMRRRRRRRRTRSDSECVTDATACAQRLWLRVWWHYHCYCVPVARLRMV